MFVKIKKNKKAFTLIELIIVIAIFAIVLTGAYALFRTGHMTYAKGTKQYDLQSSIRLASDYVTQQVRYATEAEITNVASIPSIDAIEPYQNYIYFDSANNSITHYNKYFTKVIPINHPGSIEFKKASDKRIDFNILSNYDGQQYNLNSRINIINIHLSLDKKISGAAQDSVLRFRTTDDYMSELLRPIAEIGSINEETKLEIDFDREIIEVEILNPLGVVGLSVVPSGKNVNISTTSTSDGFTILFRVTFGGLETYGNVYDYRAIYSDETKWAVH